MRFQSALLFLLKVRRREEKGPFVVQGDIEEFLRWIIWARPVQATFSDLLRNGGKDTATAVMHKGFFFATGNSSRLS